MNTRLRNISSVTVESCEEVNNCEQSSEKATVFTKASCPRHSEFDQDRENHMIFTAKREYYSWRQLSSLCNKPNRKYFRRASLVYSNCLIMFIYVHSSTNYRFTIGFSSCLGGLF